MARPKINILVLPTLTLLVGLFCSLASAQDYEETCPYNDSPQEIVYSPFKPYFIGVPGATVQSCWFWASCTLALADPSRAQQFGATALVMGLIAPTFKDIAWPGRRIIHMSQRLPMLAEIAVRALGLVPYHPESQDAAGKEKVRAWWDSSRLADRGKHKPRVWSVALCIPLLLTGGGLAVIEIYSKRASLGCVYPIFVLTWFILALLPASVHTICARYAKEIPTVPDESDEEPSSSEETSAVQGSDQIWVVQLIWAIYYIAGTLVYSSIMAVTVLELAVWVALSAAFTASCKLLAFFLCLLCEERNKPAENNSSNGTAAQHASVQAPNKAAATQGTH